MSFTELPPPGRKPSDRRAHAQNIGLVVEHMRRFDLSRDDLIGFGGEDLRSPDPHRAGKARLVENCWSLMARVRVRHVDLDDPALAIPASSPRRRRDRKPAEKRQQYQWLDENTALDAKPNEINDLANSVPIGFPRANSDEIDAAATAPPAEAMS